MGDRVKQAANKLRTALAGAHVSRLIEDDPELLFMGPRLDHGACLCCKLYAVMRGYAWQKPSSVDQWSAHHCICELLVSLFKRSFYGFRMTSAYLLVDVVGCIYNAGVVVLLDVVATISLHSWSTRRSAPTQGLMANR